MNKQYNAIVLLGPSGSGKTYLGNRLQELGIVTYHEVEPVLRKQFGAGEGFLSRMQEAGSFIMDLYESQLKQSELPVVFESGGIRDWLLWRRFLPYYHIGFIYVKTDRSLCIDRVIARPLGKNLWEIKGRDQVGQHYDDWHERVLPCYDCILTVAGDDADNAITAISRLLYQETMVVHSS